MSGQSIKDRVLAAKHSIAGQGLAKSVGKATTEEVMGPKKKHLDYLLACTNEPNVSIPNLADLLIQRTQEASWVVVFKSLIAVHNLMNYGNERFTQYLASNNCSFNLTNFLDKQNVQGYDMSTFIRRYSKYVNEKAVSYRSMAFDFCKVKRGKDDGVLRTMATEKLLKALPVLQNQLDALLDFDCTPNELTNGVINACFMLLFKDLIRLFACYNDGIINLLEKYFEMNKKQCKEALDLYKKFLVRMDKVSEFLKTAENVGIDKGEIPDLAKAPASLLEALEAHLASLEGKKGAVATSHPKPAAINNAISALSSNTGAPQGYTISESEKRKIIQEEERQLQQLKEQKAREAANSSTPVAAPPTVSPATSRPVASTASVAASPASNVDLFASPSHNSQPAAQANPSADLLQLSGNPWQSSIDNVLVLNQVAHSLNTAQPTMMASPQKHTDPWGQGLAGQQNGNGFTSDAGFAAAFGGAPQTGPGFDGFGDVLKPSKNEPEKPQSQKLFHDNVDTSLASIADNLAIKPSAQVKKQAHQWKPQGEKQKTGGANFQQLSMSSSTTSWQQSTSPMMMQPGVVGYGQPQMVQQPYMQPGMQPGMQPRPVGMQPAVGMQPVGMPAMMMQPMPGGMYQMGMPVQPQYGMAPQPMQQAQRQQQPNDPFGL